MAAQSDTKRDIDAMSEKINDQVAFEADKLSQSIIQEILPELHSLK